MARKYDLVVIGAGHAGCECANAAARHGLSTLLVTIRGDRVGWMSCNPAVGGVGKGHLVREVDALGGLMGLATDQAGIQFRTLNTSRGHAVRGSRAQCDRGLYAKVVRDMIDASSLIDVREDMVEELVVERSSDGFRLKGVMTELGEEIECLAAVLTTGTFLNGVTHIGDQTKACGREGERPATALSRSLLGLGLELGRFKTGTTPRVHGSSIDFDRMEVQPGDASPRPFSLWTDHRLFPILPQQGCYITRTNAATHRIVSDNLHLSAVSRMGAGTVPARYCPSLEEKVRRFPSREGHAVYLEPEEMSATEYYPAGLSTSLPAEVQLDMLRTIKGLERVEMSRPGYAIEYDYLVPTQLYSSLRVRGIEGLFAAGQINGTSGYEEAAAQGLLAGINVARWLAGRREVVLGRDDAYIGVLISDLTTVGTNEPYRIMTSRAEHRLRLREDNVDERLCELSHELGMITSEQLDVVRERRKRIQAEVGRLQRTTSKKIIGRQSGSPSSLATILRRPGTSYDDLASLDPHPHERVSVLDADAVEAEVQYSGYIARSQRRLKRVRQLDDLGIPEDFDVTALPGISREVQEKLKLHKPSSVGQASRISGVTPAALEILASALLKQRKTCGRPVDHC